MACATPGCDNRGSATARVTGHSRNTAARWLGRASTAATRFNDLILHDFDLIELQADELCTLVGNKNTTVWLCATIEVSPRLWASSVLGRRSDRNARAVIEDIICRRRLVGCPLIATGTSAMQAGLASTRLALRDLFTAHRVTLRVFGAGVETGAAELPTLSWPYEQRTAA